MKSLAQTIARLLCSLLFLALFTTVAVAQDPAGGKDSTAVQQLREAHKQVSTQLEQARAALEEARALPESEERDSRIEELELRLEELESRLDEINADLSMHEAENDTWEDWGEDWGEDVPDMEQDSEWSWWKSMSGENDDEESFEGNFFAKYPSTFPWMFPLTTRLHETFLRYNRVEGVYIGLAQSKRLYWHSKPWIVSTGSLGYGFANHTWRYSLGLYFPLYFDKHIVEFGGEGHSFTDSKDQWSFDRDENTFTALFAREDFLDYFERRGFTATAAWYYRSDSELNLRASVGYVHDTYGNMNRATNWSFFGGDKSFRPNPLINEGNINSFMFTAAMHTLPSLTDRSEGWNVQFSFEQAGGTAKGDFEFSQLVLDATRYQPLCEHMAINLRARLGASDGMLPAQRQFELGGPGTLPGYRFKEFAGTHAALLSAEWILRSTLAGNARGWVRNLLNSTNLIFFANAGVTNSVAPLVTRDLRNGAMEADFTEDWVFDSWKSDLGIALGSTDGSFRIGAAWRLDRGESPNFVLRFTRPF